MNESTPRIQLAADKKRLEELLETATGNQRTKINRLLCFINLKVELGEDVVYKDVETVRRRTDELIQNPESVDNKQKVRMDLKVEELHEVMTTQAISKKLFNAIQVAISELSNGEDVDIITILQSQTK